jgi:predicted DNA binding CopG/RHH family protein
MKDGDFMREEYDIQKLNPRKNPYAGKTKRQVTININTSTIDYFKEMSSETGIPYQVLINLYLDECVKEKKKIQFV